MRMVYDLFHSYFLYFVPDAVSLGVDVHPARVSNVFPD
jgi:hypothetical protein